MSTNQQPPSTVPSWPSLYDPGIEILHIEHHAPIQPEGAYLFRAKGGVTQYLCWTSLIKKTSLSKRRFPIHIVLDFNLLYPNFLALWIICFLELRFSSITSPSKPFQIPWFGISAFNHDSDFSSAIDPTPETKRTTFKSDIRPHSLDDIPHLKCSRRRYRFGCIGIHHRRLV